MARDRRDKQNKSKNKNKRKKGDAKKIAPKRIATRAKRKASSVSEVRTGTPKRAVSGRTSSARSGRDATSAGWAVALEAAAPSAPAVVATEPELVIEAEVPPPHAAPDRPSAFEQSAWQGRSAALPWVMLDEGFSSVAGMEAIDATAMARLRAHVLRLKGGRFGGGDSFVSLPADADALVHEHLRDWIGRGTHGADGVARVVVVAHDIMADESSILRLARHHAGWWLANGVYPIHLLWESGLGATLTEMAEAASVRALGEHRAFEAGVDPILEGSLRALGAPILWSGAKRGSERAFDADGGGRQLLRSLKRVIDEAGRPVELHLVGFGAGALLAAQAIRTIAAEGLGRVRTLALAAPAISMSAFRSDIAPFAGFAVRRLALFTLARDLERASAFGSYRRSFLSLLRGALEEESPSEILGLEESLRRCPDVAQVFGLGGASGAPGEAYFAGIAPDVTEATTLSHFEDDRSTLNSMLRRVLDQPEGGIVSYRPLGEAAAGAALGTDDFDRRLASELDRRGIDWAWMRAQLAGERSEAAPVVAAAASEASDASSPPSDVPGLTPTDATIERASMDSLVDVVLPTDRPLREQAVRRDEPIGDEGERPSRSFALAIGIDRYAGRPLNGAAADALLWNETFARLGFATREPLLDGDATRAEMLAQMRSLLADARAGDSVAIFFAGYGTTVRDPWEAEGADATLHLVDAIVPVDGDSGALIIGSDCVELLGDAADGVLVTLILDCSFADRRDRLAACWDASASPVADDSAERDTDIEPLRRSYPLSDVQAARHVAFRRRIGQVARPERWGHGLGVAADAGPVVITASAADESAWERDGYGAFSLAATRVLRTAHGRGELHRLSHQAFVDRVSELLAEGGQRPTLHASRGIDGQLPFGCPFVGPLTQVAGSGA
jgi:hypothetical protein